jgi:hypothetical protein
MLSNSKVVLRKPQLSPLQKQSYGDGQTIGRTKVSLLLSKCLREITDKGSIGTRVRFPATAEFFLLVTGSRPALRPTEPPIHWVPGPPSRG